MFRVDVVSKVEPEGADFFFEDNPTLRRIIEWVLEEPLEDFIHRLLIKMCQETNKDEKEADNFHIRIIHSDTPKCGFCYHHSRNQSLSLPDMLVGFADDVPDFAMTIVHEALHVLEWDEDAVERKAEEVCCAFGLKEWE